MAPMFRRKGKGRQADERDYREYPEKLWLDTLEKKNRNHKK